MKNEKLTLKGLFENYINLDHKENFLIERYGNKTQISGKYNNNVPFFFEATTKYFNKLSKDYLGYVLNPYMIFQTK